MNAMTLIDGLLFLSGGPLLLAALWLDSKFRAPKNNR